MAGACVCSVRSKYVVATLRGGEGGRLLLCTHRVPTRAQLVTGYKLRELEVKAELKDKFWGAEVADKE